MGITTKINVLLCIVFGLFVWMGFSLGGSLETDNRPSNYKEQMLQRLKEQNKEIIAAQKKEDGERIVQKVPEKKIKAPETKVVRSYSGTEYGQVIERLKDTIRDPSLAEHIAFECYSKTPEGKECVKHLVAVANAESSMFDKCGTNCFGVMYKGKLRGYADRKYSITHRVELYVKNQRYKRTTAQKWLNGRYCTSGCKTWSSNYYYGVSVLGL